MTVQGCLAEHKTLVSPYGIVKNIADLDGEQIATLSLKYADTKEQKDSFLKQAIFPTTVAALSTIVGARTPGKVANKLLSAGAVAGSILIGSKILNGFFNGASKVINSSEDAREEMAEHPALAAVGLVGGAIVSVLGIFALAKGGAKLAKNKLPSINNFATKQWGNISGLINKTPLESLNKFIQNKYSTIANKKVVQQIAKHADSAVVLGALSAIFIANEKGGKRHREDIFEAQENLLEIREDARELLDMVEESAA